MASTRMKLPLADSPNAVRWAWLGYAVSRFYFYLCFSAFASDVEVYYRYALAGVDRGLTAYREIDKLEYPPVAYWVMCLPRYMFSRPIEEAPNYKVWLDGLLEYDVRFRGLMTACDVAAFGFFVALVRRRRPDRLAWCMWGYTLTTSCLGYVLFERLDPGLTLSLMAWAYCGLRSDDEREPNREAWLAASYAALGLGISYKLIPVLLAPFALLVDFTRLVRRGPTRETWIGPLVLLLTAGGPFLYYYALVGEDLGRMFRFHADRGVEIEATYATLMMLTAPVAELQPYYDYGCWNLGGVWEMPLARAATPLLVGLLGLMGLRSLWQAFRGGGYDRTSAYLAAVVVVPVSVALAKVFSIQYLVWTLPLLILAAAEFCGERSFRAITVASIVAAALSTFIYPYHFVESMNIAPYSDEWPAPWALVENNAPRAAEGNERESANAWPHATGGSAQVGSAGGTAGAGSESADDWETAPPPPINESRPEKPHLGRLNDHGPPWWAMNVRNLLYFGCVVLAFCAWWRGTRGGAA